MTISEIAKKWLESKNGVVKQTTLRMYRTLLETRILPRLGSMERLDYAVVQDYVNDLAASGYSHSAIQMHVAIIRQMTAYMAMMTGTPVQKWRVSIKRSPAALSSDRHVLDSRESRVLMEELMLRPDADNIGILLSLSTGMRLGEVLALRWEDIDMKHRMIHVRQTYSETYDPERHAVIRELGSPKTANSRRDIPLSRDVARTLRSVRPVFHSVYVVGCGTVPYTQYRYRRFMLRLIDRLGIERIKFHGLRHTFATMAVQCESNTKLVSQILGHSKVSTTLDLYVHPSGEQGERLVNRLTKQLKRK